MPLSHTSESDGEIVESQEKATTVLPSAKDTSVNRRLREALSRSPSPGLRDYGNAPGARRDRSRSPHRDRRRRTAEQPRGEKRRRPDDSLLDGDRDVKRHTSRRQDARRGQHDHDRKRSAAPPAVRSDISGSHDGNRSTRQRSRSQSPNRRTGDVRSIHDFEGHDNYHGRGHGRMERERFNDNSVSQRAYPARPANNEAELNVTTSGKGNRVRFIVGQDGSNSQPDGISDTAAAITVSDEAAAIEERRKRREAIKNKYKTQATTLLVQTLHPGQPPASPSAEEVTSAGSVRSASPTGTSMQDLRADSPAASLDAVSIMSDTDLVNPNAIADIVVDEAEEPSAADYDPSQDMEEDRIRNGTRRHEVSAKSYDETQADNQHVLLPKSVVDTSGSPQDSSKPKGNDMFGSDDEDDMFAPIKPDQAGLGGEPSRAVPVPQAKELDMSLLDDWDDHEGYYRIILGELLDGRYHVQANLGRGVFSGVVRAVDNNTGQLVAIKIIRNNETMTKAGNKEIQILEKLAEADPEDKKHLIRLERHFTHKGHLCMVFENLSINLREVLKKFGRDVGINIKAVRSYAQQMFLALGLLRKCNILHADLKPDNVLVNEARSLLKVCDLGSAADASENDITPYLVSRFYRAPEIILGCPYDFAIDMWSVGCTLFELYTGKILFTGRTNNQMLRSMMECRGKFSLKMLKRAEFGAVHFDEVDLHFRSVERDKLTGKEVTRLINFARPTRDLKSRLLAAAAGAAGAGSGGGGSGGGVGGGNVKRMAEADVKELNLFADLLERCLALNPERRLTPAEALKHPFIHRASGAALVGGK